MHILAIETSCDETSVAVISGDPKSGRLEILSNIVSSQVEIHEKWGGVVPNLAAREHVKNITVVLDQSLEKAQIKLADIDLFATTQGPGLIPALLVGNNAAKSLSYFHQKPLLGIHHIEGHVYANFVRDNVSFPVLCLVVSGGHTQLMLMDKHLQYEMLGQTLDDAAGEAFDKVAKILNLGYPGGPKVSQQADEARKSLLHISQPALRLALENITFPRPLLSKNNLDFSFSGLKTAVLYYYRNIEKTFHPFISSGATTAHELKPYICLAFEEAIVEVLVKKTLKAAKKYSPRTVMMAGGVAANTYLREKLEKTLLEELPKTTFVKPKFELCGDNAAMIGIAAFYRYQHLEKTGQLASLADNWKILEADANLKLK